MQKDIYWTGVNDWAIRVFHGYQTDEGSSYNSYLIMDEKPTLIDCVKYPFATEHMERITAVCPMNKLEYIVMNHSEGDHSSGLPILIKHTPQATVVTNAKCKESLLILYPELKEHEKWMVVDAKTQLSIGQRTLSFVPTPMVHWPCNMFTYSASDKILFSNDGFGQHIACVERWADQLPLERVMNLVREYNANILGHLALMLQNVLKVAATLDIESILPAHGVCWRGEAMKSVLAEFSRFAHKQYHQKVSIFYDSMYCSTSKAAIAVLDGVVSTGAKAQLMDLKSNDVTKIALHLYDSAAFAVGSATLNNGMMPLVEGALGYVRGLKLMEDKPCALFGAYGWASKAVASMNEAVTKGKAVVGDQIDWRFQVNEEILSRCYQAGVKLGEAAMKQK